MNIQLLQDIRKNKTKRAYEKEILDCSHDVIIEFGGNIDLSDINEVCDFMLLNVFALEYNYSNQRKLTPNIYDRVTQWVSSRMTYGFETYVISAWLVDNNLVHKDFIPADGDLTTNMQLAAERHFQYIARTLLNNASRETFNAIL